MHALPLHEDLRALAFLVGTWRGEGIGGFPTIDDFAYEEEIVIQDIGDTYLTYAQRSWVPGDGAPIHLERGFIRRGSGQEVELTLAHPLGLTEIAHGTPAGTSITFVSDRADIGRTRTGSDVSGMVRAYEVEGDRMSYRIDMATDRTPMTLHLEGTLRRRS